MIVKDNIPAYIRFDRVPRKGYIQPVFIIPLCYQPT